MDLKTYLKQHRIPQHKFAAIVGTTQGWVSLVANGKYILTGETAIQWAKATNWTVTPHNLNPKAYPNPTDGLPQENDGSTAAA
ncbi:transcriptional regulator [Serratia proteamaculans]|uniref:Transcriptional regulator n=1 Tax=Serratia proteamaculans TaxID=28151 RepID=A0A5Q2VLA7_SERPR|nr:transcriptional regulator [Serratia proteamaculans]QGH64183.1 transcriptional regulator [Serratia proteamaculans]